VSVHLPTRIKEAARAAGFDLCGIAPVREFGELKVFPAWIADGKHGEMKYMEARNEAGELKRGALARVAPWVRIGLFSVGFTMFLDEVRSLVSDMQFTWGERQIMGIVGLSYLLGFGLAGWVAGRLISTGAELIDVFVDQAESSARTANLLEQHAIPALGRIALAIEKLSVEEKPEVPEADDTPRRFEVARQSIAAARWAQADKLVGSLPDKLRQPLILSTIEEMSPREVAATLGINEAAVRSRVFRARQILKQKLEQRVDRK